MKKYKIAFPQTANGFTIVELLVVITIIAVLIAILLPSIARARDVAKRVTCAANVRGTVFTCLVYANDQRRFLPAGVPNTDVWPLNQFRNTTSPVWDLRTRMKGYITNWRAWVCPATKAAPLDDAGNTRHAAYTNYFYFPNTLGPFYGTAGKKPAPHRVENSPAPYAQVMLQDHINDRAGAVVSPNEFWSNHGRGTAAEVNYLATSDNPSYRGLRALSKSDIDGGNLGFYDGSTRFFFYSELARSGFNAGVGGGNGWVISVLTP